MIERRARWERALACTRGQLGFDICASFCFLALGVGLHPRLSSAVIVLVGFVGGFIVHTCIRLVLALPPFARRVDWESGPRVHSTPRYFATGLLVMVLFVPAGAVVYTSTGDPDKSLFALIGGMSLAHALITAVQRFYLDRDFMRCLPEL